MEIKVRNILELITFFENKNQQKNLLVCPNYLKKNILHEIEMKNTLIDIKIMDEKTFFQEFGYFIDPICLYLIYKDTKNYQLSKNIYNYLKYNLSVSDEEENLKTIIKYQNEFLKKGLIRKDIAIENTEYKVYVLDSKIDNIIKNYVEVNLLENKERKFNIYQFNNIQEELTYVFAEIAKLIEKENVSINDIEVVSNNANFSYLKTIANFYNIPTKLNKKVKLISNYNLKKMTEDLKDKTLVEAIEEYQKIIPKKYLEKIYAIINDYIEVINEKEFKLFFKEILKNTTLQIIDEIDSLSITKEKDLISKKYTFIVGFNDYDYDSFYLDEDFISDHIKQKLKLKDSQEKNKDSKKSKSMLYNENVFISYSKNILGKEVEVNQLVNNKNIIEVSNEEVLLKSSKRYSKSYDNYNYQQKKKIYRLNKMSSKTLEILKNNEKLFDFNLPKDKSINNKIKIDKRKLKEEFTISATHFDAYYKCPFKFYLEKFLKLRRYQDSEKINIGNYLHKYLEFSLIKSNELENIILEEQKHNYKNDHENKKEFYLNKLNKHGKILTEIIKEQMAGEKFKLFANEKELETKITGYALVGKIDNILHDDFDNFIVIDYKSTKGELLLNNDILQEKENQQNIIYFILLYDNYEKVRFAGTYRYRLIPKIAGKENKYLRNGITNKETNILNEIDFENYSGLVKNKKDGSLKKGAKVVDDKEFQEKIEIVEKNIKTFLQEIEQGKFPVKPKSLDVCKFCQFKDVCYKNKRDILYK